MEPEVAEKLANRVLPHAIKQGARRIALGSAPGRPFAVLHDLDGQRWPVMELPPPHARALPARLVEMCELGTRPGPGQSPASGRIHIRLGSGVDQFFDLLFHPPGADPWVVLLVQGSEPTRPVRREDFDWPKVASA